jgi:transcriptional regulator with PAS, ATPase and Fis domain
VTATHKNVHQAMQQGAIRKDFYYRLCSDIITTPALHQQIKESPEVLWDLVGYLSQREAGPEGDKVAAEVTNWIRDHLGLDYPWPGNIRELEQCVRSWRRLRRDPSVLKGYADCTAPTYTPAPVLTSRRPGA